MKEKAKWDSFTVFILSYFSWLQELTNSKKMINEFEAILEQGQVDFDEMTDQLEQSRQNNESIDKKLHKTSKENVKLQAEREVRIVLV